MPGAPFFVATDGDDNVHVSFPNANRLRTFSPTGKVLTEWGSSGSGPGEFECPGGIAIDAEGNLFLAESTCGQQLNNRVQRLGDRAVPVVRQSWGRMKSRYR
jgi:hypothetical protein